jgi:hypothetical protein
VIYRNLILLSLSLSLAACAGQTPSICPQIAAVHDLAQLADFGRSEKPVRTEFVAAARIDHVLGACHTEGDTISADVDIALRAYRGPRLGGERVEFPYFVAVLDQNDKVISKQSLTVTFALAAHNKFVDKLEQIHLTIPNPKNLAGSNWRVLTGFQLSPEQLAYNRGEFGEPIPTASPAGQVWRNRAQ